MTFSFEITSKDKNSRARTGIIKTSHGKIETPYLITVATRAEVITLNKKEVKSLNLQALLSNTYHLHLRPGEKVISQRGGLHKFMNFNKPIFTDSGGFQVLSLGKGREQSLRKMGFLEPDKPQKESQKSKEKIEDNLAKITRKGIWFTSVYDGTKHFMGPKESMEIQAKLGADIIMAFDECPSRFEKKRYIKKSMKLSHKWEKLSLKYFKPSQNQGKAIYGIIHGGWFEDLRKKSAKFINSQPFNGIAIGGALGDSKEQMHEVLEWIIPLLDDRPRHMLGIGRVDDLFECVERGIDTFDCVDHTRIARHGNMLVSPKSGGNKENKFRIMIKNANFAKQKKKVDSSCKCLVCKKYTRSDLYKMSKENPLECGKLATIHNITFMENLTKQIRDSIKKGKFKELKKRWLC